MIRIDVTHDRVACHVLRHTVFCIEQGYSAADEVDAVDVRCHHLLALDGATPVGTARVLMEEQTARIGRVCVLQSHRGTGLGADLIRAAIAHACELGAARAELGAQTYAIGFYEKLGFAPYGDPYGDEGQEHRMMARSL